MLFIVGCLVSGQRIFQKHFRTIYRSNRHLQYIENNSFYAPAINRLMHNTNLFIRFCISCLRPPRRMLLACRAAAAGSRQQQESFLHDVIHVTQLNIRYASRTSGSWAWAWIPDAHFTDSPQSSLFNKRCFQ